MEKARLRGFDFALLQDQQIGSGRAAIKTQLHLHFHPYFSGVGDEDFSARSARDGRVARFLSGAAGRPHPVVARRFCVRRHLHQRDCHYGLREQKIFR